MKIVLAAVLAIGSFAFPAAPATAAAVDRSNDGGVIVTALTERERGTGAGTIVAVSGERVSIVTAKHVATFGLLSVQVEDGVTVPARIVALVPGEDVAIIEATVDPDVAAGLHVAPVAAPRAHESVRVWGSGEAFESGSVIETGGPMPDGAAAGRYALACSSCRRGDSGGGVFDENGDLVGIYVGYFTYDSGARVSVAALPEDAIEIAAAMDGPSVPDSKIALSTRSSMPSVTLAATGARVLTASRIAPSTMTERAVATATDRSAEIVAAAPSASK
ncbi:MAG: trypsin-like peptidase domain-containing protein [Candidatus Eremiobacteraeota bacterium]|nr:trypsin-like peptidase domain-containing protein [Candidatus Eremiobacteraeota bacterium]